MSPDRTLKRAQPLALLCTLVLSNPAFALLSLTLEGALSSQEVSSQESNAAHSSIKLSMGALKYRFEGTQGLIIRDLFSGADLTSYSVMDDRTEHGQLLEGGGVRLSGLQRHLLRLDLGGHNTKLQLQYQAVRAQRELTGSQGQDVLFDHQLISARGAMRLADLLEVSGGYQQVSFGSHWFQGFFNGPKGDDSATLPFFNTPPEARSLKGWNRGELFIHLSVSPEIQGLSALIGYVSRFFSEQRLISDSGGILGGAEEPSNDERRRDQLLYVTTSYRRSIMESALLGETLKLSAGVQLTYEKNSSNQGRLGGVSFMKDAYSFTRYRAEPSLQASLGSLRLMTSYLWASRDFEGREGLSRTNVMSAAPISERSTVLRLSLDWALNSGSSVGLYALSQRLESDNNELNVEAPDLYNHDAQYQELGLLFKMTVN